MAITERLMGPGNFTVTFSQEFTPTAIIEAIKEWGHIVITPQEIDIDTLSDSEILNSSRYTGIVLNRTLEEGSVQINGQGLELYMGDGNAKGMVIAESNNVGKVRNYTATTLSETLFNSTAQTNKPLGIMLDEAGNLQAITQGTISNPASTYTGSHFVETALSALKFVCEILNVEYRVNPNATIDAGPQANLFEGVGTAEPNSIIVKTAYGQDPEFEGVVPQGLRTEFDASDWVSRVDFTGEVGFFDTATDVAGEANLGSNPYKDLHGNELKRVALVQEPDVPEANLNTKATTMLNELSRIKKVLNLDLEQYEVSGDMKVGDYIYAFDPDVGFKDTATDATAESRDLYEITFRGQTITPVKIRVLGLTFPVTTGMGCYYRDKDGNYTDITEYVNYENGAAQVELGDLIRTIGDDLRFSEFSLSKSTAGAFSIPDLPSTPTLQSGTYLNATGDSSGFIRVTVSRPTNIDGSQITDGSHYKIRYKRITESDYSYQNFPFTGVSSESLLIQDLTVGETYDVGVAVVDKSGFKKMSAYDGTGSDLYTNSSSINPSFATNARVEIEKDGQAPSKPKAATIAAGPLRVQVTHYLGKDGTDGGGNPFGNFTLEGDVDHLDVYAVTQSGNSANFTVATSNKIGEVRVTSGNLLQAIPVIATIELEDSEDYYFRIVAVDKSGNSSDPSDGQTATANLIAEANIADATITTAKIGEAQITNALIADATITTAKINDLSADKITSGTITGGEITVGGVSNTSGFIKSYNFSSGSAGWAINSDGSAEFANATVRGTLNASDITAGTLDASNITVTNLNAGEISTGTLNVDRLPTITTSQINFTASDIDGVDPDTILATINASSEGIEINANKLDLSGSLSVGDALDVGGSDASSFHVDVNGNMWLGAATYASAPFKVSNAGALAASSFSLTGGSATNLALQVATQSSGTPTSASSSAIKIGTSVMFEQSNKLKVTKPFVVLPDGSESAPSLTISGDYDELGFFVTNTTSEGGYSTFSASNGTDDIFAFNTLSDQFNIRGEVQVAGNLAVNSGLKAGGVTGSSGQVLQSTGSGVQWADAGGSHADSDHTSFADSSHNHSIGEITGHSHSGFLTSIPSEYLTETEGDGRYLTSASHGSHGTFVSSSTAVTSISSGGSGMKGAISVSGTGSGFFDTISQDTQTVRFTRSGVSSVKLRPASSSANYGLGDSTYRWLLLYSQFNTNVSSDERLKENIAVSDLGLDFINDLEPKKFTYIRQYDWVCTNTEEIVDSETSDCNTCDDDTDCVIVWTDVTGIEADAVSYGLIAQDVEQLQPTGTNWNLVRGEGDETKSIAYTELISPLIKAVQELSQQNSDLLARIEVLEG